MGKKGKGNGFAFARMALSYEGTDCLIWPYNRGAYGYGTFSLNGEIVHAHRWICEQVHGPAPTPEHQAAHDCGNGHEGCIHPKHVFWKTALENAQDKIKHGTCYSEKGRPRQKLTQDQVAEIRQCKTVAEQFEIARRFGISDSNVRKIIYGKAWTKPKRFNELTEDQVRSIRSLKGTAAARIIGEQFSVSHHVIYNIWNGKFWTHVQ